MKEKKIFRWPGLTKTCTLQKIKKDKGKKQEKKKHDICYNAPLPQPHSFNSLFHLAPGAVATTFLNYFSSREQK